MNLPLDFPCGDLANGLVVDVGGVVGLYFQQLSTKNLFTDSD